MINMLIFITGWVFDDNENGHPTIHFVRISKLKNNEGDIPGVG